MAEIVTPEQIDRAAAVLRTGGLVAFPTETVYGLGANALDAEAVAGIFEAKGRPTFDPLIVHVTDAGEAAELVASFPPLAEELARRFWPGPLTMVLPKKPIVPDLVTAGLSTVAVRVPGHELARALIARARVPVAAPSANRFGGVSPTRAEHVAEELSGRIDLILDGGPCRTGVESTVISLTGVLRDEPPVLLRPGGLPVEQIEEVTGPLAAPRTEDAAADAEAGRMSPGMLDRHYAPRTPMRLVDDFDASPGAGVALLSFRELEPALAERAVACEVLSRGGDLRQAAAALFAAIRRLDGSGAELILAQRVPDRGLGRAINDRLRRAAGSGAEVRD
ncbi:MAG: L-threonylcarbamoyladenylate synthase [Phycisphaeraceae bacterium]